MSANKLEVSDLMHIPGGTFRMGQADGKDEEKSVHLVIWAPFRLSRYQLTNAHLDYFCCETGRERKKFVNPTAPVASVNWYDAVAYCHWLSSQWFMRIRLPSEAE